MKKFTLIALALLLTLGLAVPVLGSINREHIVEDIDVLDETDASTIEDLGEEIKEAYGIHPIFFLMKHYEMDDYYGFIDQKLAELDVEDRFLFILIDAEHNEYSYAGRRNWRTTSTRISCTGSSGSTTARTPITAGSSMPSKP